MTKKLQKEFISYCNSQQLEVNSNQVDVINKLEQYYQGNFQSYFSKLFSKKSFKKGFYLYGGVGVGKTMILNFFFDLDLYKDALGKDKDGNEIYLKDIWPSIYHIQI